MFCLFKFSVISITFLNYRKLKIGRVYWIIENCNLNNYSDFTFKKETHCSWNIRHTFVNILTIKKEHFMNYINCNLDNLLELKKIVNWITFIKCSFKKLTRYIWKIRGATSLTINEITTIRFANLTFSMLKLKMLFIYFGPPIMKV